MNTKTKDLLKGIIEQHVALMARDAQHGTPTDAQMVAAALHGLSLQVGEIASALGRIYMALEGTKKEVGNVR